MLHFMYVKYNYTTLSIDRRGFINLPAKFQNITNIDLCTSGCFSHQMELCFLRLAALVLVLFMHVWLLLLLHHQSFKFCV